MVSVPFPLKPGQPDVEFRFSIRHARDLERAAGCNYKILLARGEQIHAICLMVCYGLRHADARMTEEKATALVDRYVEEGGNIVTLFKALEKAMSESGVYGPPAAEESADEDPPKAPAAETPAIPRETPATETVTT